MVKKPTSSFRTRIPLLALIVVLLIISFMLNLLPIQVKPTTQIVARPERVRLTSSDLPILPVGTSFPVLSAQGVIAIDVDSASILYEKNADYPLLPASTTKIMTALVALDTYKLDQVITVPLISVEGQKMHLVGGEQITFEDLLSGLLIYSANDAAEVLAASYPGGRDAFILAMNEKTTKVGMKNTKFVNPTGLDAQGHRSTARDMVRLSQIAMRNETIAKVVGIREKVVKSTDGRFIHYLKNINELLGAVDGVYGIKTGWTEAARENLVTIVKRNDRTIIIALLGSQDRFGETKELIEWLYKNYTWEKIITK
jgi:serine-type D-Ala-D-Ala carboxypeptidase (penicillin-binding protein 5/6)